MSEQKIPRSVEQRIVIKFLVGENVPSAEIHHRLQQQYGEECLLRRSIPGGVTEDFFPWFPRQNHVPWVDSASESEYQGFLLG